MTDRGNSDNGQGTDAEDGERSGRRRRRSRRASGGGDDAGQGFGGGFGGAFPPGLMQLLPLLMAMGGGGGFPGAGAVNFQLKLLSWMLETWLDYLAAMQEVFERALDRLHDMQMMGGWGKGDENRDW